MNTEINSYKNVSDDLRKKSKNIIPVSLASFCLVFLFDVLFGSVICVVRKIEISLKQKVPLLYNIFL